MQEVDLTHLKKKKPSTLVCTVLEIYKTAYLSPYLFTKETKGLYQVSKLQFKYCCNDGFIAGKG